MQFTKGRSNVITRSEIFDKLCSVMEDSGEWLESGCRKTIEDRITVVNSGHDKGLYQSAEAFFIQTIFDLPYSSEMEKT